MLYERWREIAREFSPELALIDLPSRRKWTFAELNAASESTAPPGPVVYPQGNTADFVIEVLRGWRHRRVVCPIEPGQATPIFPLPPSPIAHLKVTSATTGAPKLVAFRGEQLAADADNIIATMGLRRDWPNLSFISLAHSYGFSNLVTPLLLHGIPLFIGGHPFPETVRGACEEFGAVTLAGVPALWRVWHEAAALTPGIRLAISAGAPLGVELEREVFERSLIKIHNFYGATESGGIAYDDSPVPRVDAGCVGRPMKNVSLSINADGCLVVRGINVGESYWPEPAPAIADGVYTTSDLAEMRDGLVWLRGRASDVINVAGRKIAPETVERLLSAHPDVRECLVFGVPSKDTQRGDTMVACVTARNSITAESLRSYLLARSDAWQVPREFWFVDSLEANARGKQSRAQWRARFLERAK